MSKIKLNQNLSLVVNSALFVLSKLTLFACGLGEVGYPYFGVRRVEVVVQDGKGFPLLLPAFLLQIHGMHDQLCESLKVSSKTGSTNRKVILKPRHYQLPQM